MGIQLLKTIKDQARLGLKMKSIFFVLITIFCSTTSAGRPGKRNNLKFECKGTSSYQKKGDTIFGVIAGCGDGLQKEIDLMAKKVKNKTYCLLILRLQMENFLVGMFMVARLLCIFREDIQQESRVGKDLQHAIKAFRDEVSQFNDDLVSM